MGTNLDDKNTIVFLKQQKTFIGKGLQIRVSEANTIFYFICCKITKILRNLRRSCSFT